jgi:hypothetical protein
MSSDTIQAVLPPPSAPGDERATLLALARADARRYARHPLFVLPCAVMVLSAAGNLVTQNVGGTNPLLPTMAIAFLLGVFGFVVAHRLTTSLRRTRELASTVPVEQQRRTLALCLACLVPASAGLLAAGYVIVQNVIWPPEGIPPGAPVSWFGDYPAVDVIATLLAAGTFAALGGPLLGVAVARWAPFRGSALLGVVALVVATAMTGSDEPGGQERMVSAWPIMIDEHVVHGEVVSTTFVPVIEPIWALGWVLCLCGLAVVAALLRDPGHRRQLLIAGGALTAAAAACFVLALS